MQPNPPLNAGAEGNIFGNTTQPTRPLKFHVYNHKVVQLGTLMEALQPVPGLDPDAFLSIIRDGCGEAEQKGLDYRDVKVVQLAKRARALAARLEGERAR